MKLGGGVLVGAAGENVGDLIVGGKKPLHLPWRLVALYDPLASSGRLMRILCPGTIRNFVRGGAVETNQAIALVKRSPNKTANWASAMDHSRGGMIHSFSERFKTRKRKVVPRRCRPYPHCNPTRRAWRGAWWICCSRSYRPNSCNVAPCTRRLVGSL
jgi:hypothetical protein